MERFEAGLGRINTEPVVHTGGRNSRTGLGWDALRAKSETATSVTPIPSTATKESPMTKPTPEYITELSDLMRDTEGHPDVLVRQIRKIITQAAVTLKTAYNAAEATADPTTTSAPILTAVPDQPTKAKKAAAPTKAKSVSINTNPNSVDARLVALNTTAADVRSWALTNGLTKSTRGRIGIALVDAWATAHGHAA